MRNRAAAIVILLVGGLMVTTQARGQRPTWVGTTVVTKFKTPLRVGSDLVDNDDEFRVYTVERVSGDWLWLVAGRVSGWVRSGQVVPLVQAIGFYTQEIQANPRTAPIAYLRRGLVRSARGDTDAALADYNEAIRLNPKSATAFSCRGQTWLDMEQYDKAIIDFTASINLERTDARAFARRAAAWKLKGEPVRAFADFDEAVRLDPKNWELLYKRGIARMEAGRLDFLALADFNRAIRLDSKAAMIVAGLARGTLLGRRGEFEKAVRDFEEVIRLQPENAAALNNLAYIGATCPDAHFRDGPKAVAPATRACALSAKASFVYVATLAAAHAEAGDFVKAVESQEKANRLATDEARQKEGARRLALFKAGKPFHEEPVQ